jgi:L-ascorbate metabolism protein UlaG (beta-lactamase superfamily)
MKIKWLGQAAFLIESKTTLVTDPFAPIIGRLPKDLVADVVTVSHSHFDHNYVKGVGGSPEVINSIGKFSVGTAEITGVATFHDNVGGRKRGNNIVFVVKAEGLTLCHLGDLGHILSDKQIKEIGPVDILMIPVGGGPTIDATQVVQTVSQLKPKVVLPMHYKSKKSLIPLPFAGVDKFVDAFGWEVVEVKELEIDKSNIDSFDQKVVIFKR